MKGASFVKSKVNVRLILFGFKLQILPVLMYNKECMCFCLYIFYNAYDVILEITNSVGGTSVAKSIQSKMVGADG